MKLRTFIEMLETTGVLHTIDSRVDWRFELGSKCRELKGKPVLFKDIIDYPDHVIFTGGLSSVESFCLALNIDSPVSYFELVSELKQRFQNTHKPEILNKRLSPLNYTESNSVDLSCLPVPWWHESDGGRYIGTWHANISKDPITGIRNAGVYRMKIIDKTHTTVSASPKSHLAQQVNRSEKLGKDLEMAVAIGTEEEVVIAASAALPYGMDEMSAAGGLLKKPLKLIQCQTVSLEVPLATEIVLEGVIKKGSRVTDGPFMDYSGKCNVNKNAFLFEIRAMQVMNKCIFRGMAVGNAGTEDHLLFSLLSHLGLTDFHGSRVRHIVQCFFLRYRLFRLFQMTGRFGTLLKNDDF